MCRSKVGAERTGESAPSTAGVLPFVKRFPLALPPHAGNTREAEFIFIIIKGDVGLLIVVILIVIGVVRAVGIRLAAWGCDGAGAARGRALVTVGILGWWGARARGAREGEGVET